MSLLAVLPQPLNAQDHSAQDSSVCIAKGEKVFYSNEKGLKHAENLPNATGGEGDSPKVEAGKRGPTKFQATLEVVPSSAGRVCDVRNISTSNRDFAAEAAKYAKEHWRFAPATLDGKPVPVRIIVELNVKLKG